MNGKQVGKQTTHMHTHTHTHTHTHANTHTHTHTHTAVLRVPLFCTVSQRIACTSRALNSVQLLAVILLPKVSLLVVGCCNNCSYCHCHCAGLVCITLAPAAHAGVILPPGVSICWP